MFDEFGRVIPDKILATAHIKSRRYFSFPDIDIDLERCYSRLVRHLAVADLDLSLDVFRQRIDGIQNDLRSDPDMTGVLNGAAIPFFIPKQEDGDIGGSLDSVFLPAVAASYKEAFPDYSFDNHNQEPLAGRLSSVAGARHSNLLERASLGAVVGMLFPCLTEYSVPAAIEVIGALPERFLLAGAFDTSAALIACPELLFKRESYPPLIWMSGIQDERSGFGYHFEAYGYNLTFNRRAHLDQCAEYWASSVVVIA